MVKFAYTNYMNGSIKTFTAKQARDNFTDILGMVYYGKAPVVVEKKGRPFAVVVNPTEYEKYEKYKKAARKRILEIIEEIQTANKDADYEEVLKDATEAVKEIRKQRYAGRK